jgi:hypothetical protein
MRSVSVPETSRKNCLDRFSTLKDNCSAQDKFRELKLVSLGSSGNKDSEYVFFFRKSVKETATQNVRPDHEKSA